MTLGNSAITPQCMLNTGTDDRSCARVRREFNYEHPFVINEAQKKRRPVKTAFPYPKTTKA